MDENIQEGQFEEVQKIQEPSKLDKIGDVFGAWAGAIVLTLLAAALLGAFFTIIPTVTS